MPSEDGWKTYLKNTENKVPSSTLIFALSNFFAKHQGDKELLAIDFGCGNGADTMKLIERGWKVIVVDSDKMAVENTKKRIPDSMKSQLVIWNKKFEDIRMLPPVDLINANSSMSFCHPDYFWKFWSEIKDSITPGGVFAGNFFGKNDTWASRNCMTFFEEQDIKTMFEGFQIKPYVPKEKNGMGKQ